MSHDTLTPPAASPLTRAIMLEPAAHGAPGIELSRKLDRLHAAIAGTQAVPARLLRARPVTDPDGMLVVMDERKRCLVEIRSLDELEPSSRLIAREELARRYCIPVIQTVERTLVDFGNRYWTVLTDRGRRSFLLRDPQRNVCHLPPDEVLLRDVLGNRYRIPSLRGLDLSSQLAVEAAI